ncbi:hypothetical protein I4F81_007842 [Pyropia yezoensis]|uniref:Uncharacterized protein n=1 Tax=Pyropia yezoensis TaxID=2788 RepID=A0ACC3C4Q3_PYRYE|nr:hypothetical protein I4F81_007842 [Neopyropia yezoensis]
MLWVAACQRCGAARQRYGGGSYARCLHFYLRRAPAPTAAALPLTAASPVPAPPKRGPPGGILRQVTIPSSPCPGERRPALPLRLLARLPPPPAVEDSTSSTTAPRGRRRRGLDVDVGGGTQPPPSVVGNRGRSPSQRERPSSAGYAVSRCSLAGSAAYRSWLLSSPQSLPSAPPPHPTTASRRAADPGHGQPTTPHGCMPAQKHRHPRGWRRGAHGAAPTTAAVVHRLGVWV